MAEDDKQEPKIKVTDKRMFTADGELRDDYQHLGDSTAAESASEPPAEPSAEAAPRQPPPAEPPSEPAPAPEDPGVVDPGEPLEPPDPLGPARAPGFVDLLGILAEPIAIYLGDARLPDGSSAENLEAARFYIDLLEVLKEKTEGNLTDQEKAVLQDLLYQLRMRYVRKRG